MIHRMNRIAPFLALAVAAVCSASEPPDRDPLLTGCRDALLAQFDKLESALPEMTRSADAAAERLLGGGRLFAAGQPGFVNEARGRAGGLMMLSGLDARTALSEKDVLLVGALTNADEAAENACRRGKEAGAYVVLFSPAFEEPKPPIAGLCGAHVVNFAPAAGQEEAARDAAAVAENRRAVAASSLFNMPALWTYTGELIGSLTRKGKMPVVWQSIMLEGSQSRNAKYFAEEDASKRRFHEDLSVPPQPEGRIGRLYLDALRRQVRGLRGPVLEQMAAAAALMADCVRAGGAVHVESVSHYTIYDIDLPGRPAWAKHPKRYPEPAEIAAAMKPGDVYFEIGYMELRLPFLEAAARAGGKSIVALCHAPPVPLDGPQPAMLMDAQWEYGDAAVLLPGYDVEILPTSAVLQTALFRTVLAKAEALAAK
ncbi:MAG: hypothetical protein ACLQVA_07885 [Candidatus Brocadiia bacterium]